MDKMLYVAMTGAKYAQLAQATAVNNLANASTPGFRGDFQTLMAKAVEGPGFETRVNSLTGDRATNLAFGPLQATGSDMDIAFNGEGWFAVKADDGSEAYTRRGDLRVMGDGALVNGAGQPVMGQGGTPIVLPPYQSLSIGSDGTVSIIPQGQSAATLAVVDRIKMVRIDPNNIVKRDDGLMRTRDGSTANPDVGLKVASGSLEASNISAVDAMVSMISLSRQYDWQMSMMKTAQQVSDNGNGLMRLE